MFSIKKNDFSDLNSFQKQYLLEIKKIKPTSPFSDWNKFQFVNFEGLFACGWTSDNLLLMVNYNGYQLVNPLSGKVVEENFERLSYNYMSNNNLEFILPKSNQRINIFGIFGGKGNLVTSDGWILDIVYPYWPNCLVSLKRPKIDNENILEIWEGIKLIKLEMLEYSNLNCGFSNNEKHFFISGNLGVEIYSRCG